MPTKPRPLKMERFAPIVAVLSGFWMVFLGAANAMSLKLTGGAALIAPPHPL